MIQLIVEIGLLGLLVWAVQTIIPMPEPFKKVIFVIAVVCLAYIVLNAFGLWPASFGHLQAR